MKNIILSIIILFLLSINVNADTYFWQQREAVDCTALTDGTASDLCRDTSDQTVWACVPTVGLCDTPGEWKQITTDLSALALKTTTINGHALNANVTVTASDVGLGNVDNTSDANKPISSATQTALNGKEPTLTKGNASAGTGISVAGGTGAVIGSGMTITNTAPDQTVSLSAGTGIGISGTYPSFTVSNTQTSAIWGNITGTLSAQTDLQNALNAKQATLTPSTGISISTANVITNISPDQVVSIASGTGISASGTYPSFTVTNTAPDQTVALTGNTGISVSGTYPSFDVTNTAPDQTVSITGNTGISATGTYPNFTVTNTLPDQTVSITPGTGIGVSGTYPNFTVSNTSVINWDDQTTINGVNNSINWSLPSALTGINNAINWDSFPNTQGYLTSVNWSDQTNITPVNTSSGWTASTGKVILTTSTDSIGIGTSFPSTIVEIKKLGNPSVTINAVPQQVGDVDSYTKLLLHMDGTTGSTIFTDSSPYSHTMTANGDWKISTSAPNFGTGSSISDGDSDYMTIDNPFTVFGDFGYGDFTIDFWAKFTGTGTAKILNNTGTFYIDKQSGYNNGYLRFIRQGLCSYTVLYNPSTSWHHYAFVRSGSVILVFIDGVKKTWTTATEIGENNIDIQNVYFGSTGTASPVELDEFRVSSIARWTSTFTVYPYAYADSSIVQEPSVGMQISGTQSAKMWTDGNSSNNFNIDVPNVTRMTINASGNVGIGTTVPRSLLEVGVGKLNVLTAGNVGINSTVPRQALDVVGSALVSGTATIGTATVSNTLTVVTNVGVGTTLPVAKLDTVGAGTTSATSNLILRNSSKTALVTVLDNGNVGIGTTSPVSKLDLVGIGTTSSTSALTIRNSAGTANVTVLDGGNVGIGSSSPVTKLDVAGKITQANSFVQVSKNATQALSSQTYTKITFQVETYDTDNEFSSSTFTAKDSGYYIVFCAMRIDTAGLEIYPFVNGVSAGSFAAISTWPSGTLLLKINAGSTLEIYGWCSGACTVQAYSPGLRILRI